MKPKSCLVRNVSRPSSSPLRRPLRRIELTLLDLFMLRSVMLNRYHVRYAAGQEHDYLGRRRRPVWTAEHSAPRGNKRQQESLQGIASCFGGRGVNARGGISTQTRSPLSTKQFASLELRCNRLIRDNLGIERFMHMILLFFR